MWRWSEERRDMTFFRRSMIYGDCGWYQSAEAKKRVAECTARRAEAVEDAEREREMEKREALGRHWGDDWTMLRIMWVNA